MLPSLDVENVYIYIADAVRYDFVPKEIVNEGVDIKTIAAGIHSPTSIASIVSGTYLPQHKVKDFVDTLPGDVPNLLKSSQVNIGFSNSMNDVRFDPGGSEDIIATTLGVDSRSPEFLEDIEPPFVFVERGPGGHAPYVEKHELDTGQNYFHDRGAAPRSTFAKEYRQAVREDMEWFRSRTEVLEQRGLREDTLIIYTSDHGEMLGESGMQSHSPPIHPSHVYVPTVFLHPSLGTGSHENVLRHVDILPTISSLLDTEWSTPVPPVGRDLVRRSPATWGASFHSNTRETSIRDITIAFDSIWDKTGGYVFPQSSLSSRLLLAAHHATRGSWKSYARAHFLKHLIFKLRTDRVHGAPAIGKSEACEYLEEVREYNRSMEEVEPNDVPTDRLKELGYME